MKKVSVVIPVYNTSKYISECLNSVLSQSYYNLEIIVINDGSTDNSLEKILEFQKKDKRIIVVDNENHGVAYSRNIGIKYSTGYYLTFIDSDDIISTNYIFILVNNLEATNSDCSICGIKPFYTNVDIGKYESNIVIYDNQDQMKIGLLYELKGYLANKMYTVSIIKEKRILFNENIHISEDLLFNLYYFEYCEKIVYDTTICYFYRQHNASAYNNLTNKKWFSVLDTYQLMLEKEKNNNKVYNELVYYYGLTILEAKYRLNLIGQIDNRLMFRLRNLEKKYIPFYRYLNLRYFVYKFFPCIVMFYRQRKMKG